MAIFLWSQTIEGWKRAATSTWSRAFSFALRIDWYFALVTVRNNIFREVRMLIVDAKSWLGLNCCTSSDFTWGNIFTIARRLGACPIRALLSSIEIYQSLAILWKPMIMHLSHRMEAICFTLTTFAFAGLLLKSMKSDTCAGPVDRVALLVQTKLLRHALNRRRRTFFGLLTFPLGLFSFLIIFLDHQPVS